MFWLINSIQVSFAEPVFWDEYEENWFLQLDKLNEQVVFGGRVLQDEGTYAWIYSWDQEWSVLAEERSEMQAMATNDFQIALCGLSREEELPKAWAWMVDQNGESIREILLVENGVSDCTSIISYQDGWLASVVLREPTQKRSILITISADGELEEIFEPFDDIEIMGVSQKEGASVGEIALTGFALEPEKTSGWIGVLDQDLELSWSQKLGEGDFNKFKNISMDEQGNLLSCGYTTPQAPDNWDIWLLRWNWKGDILFETIWGGELKDGCKGLKPSSSGFAFIGDSESFDADGWDVLRGEVDSEGEIISYEIFGDLGDDYGYDFLLDDNRIFWIGALERDEDAKMVAWAELAFLPEEEAGDTGLGEKNQKDCGCHDSKSGLLLLPLFGLFWRRRI